MPKRALIIDGNSIINRAFFAIRNLTTAQGFPTNALYGFLSIYQSIDSELKPDYAAVAFDLKGPTLRHRDFEAYKAGRKGMPDELAMQLPVLKEILQAMGITMLALAGYEADDMLGTAATFLEAHDVESYLLTGDKDALQLVTDKTYVYYHGTKNKRIYTPEVVEEDLGVSPARVVDLKGLMGDSSDNIPGVPGIGKVTARKLLSQFDSLEDILRSKEHIGNTRIRNLIDSHAEQAILSKKLATIICDVPITLQMEEFKTDQPDLSQLIALLQKYQLHTFLDKLSVDRAADLTRINSEHLQLEKIEQAEPAAQFLSGIDFNERLYLKALYHKKTIVADEAAYIALSDGERHAVFSGAAMTTLLEALKSHPLHLVGDDLKHSLLLLERYQICKVTPVFDSQIAMYLIDANRRSYALDDMVLDLLGKKITSRQSLLGKGAKQKTFLEVDKADVYQYLSDAISGFWGIYPLLKQKLAASGAQKLFEEVEMPLVSVLANMEYIGFSVDPTVLERLDLELCALIKDIESDIYQLAGSEFNINSPKQLSVVLFETLKLPVIKKTKTGYSTSHDVLLKLQSEHQIIDKIISYRTYTKLKSTYVDGLRAVINPVTGRIHSSLNQTVAATGRLSSKDPNLQNIPVRLDMGRRLRKVFTASQSRLLVDADYSQIELRILAHMSEDPTLLKAYQEDIDIHAMTAAQVFETELSEVTSLLRSRAKEVNFGIIYGMSDYGLSENLDISRAEAKQYIDNYFAKYPDVRKFMDRCIADCKETGYAETLLGRRRSIPEIYSKNYNTRQYGERMAMNTPIQGSAADIIKKAMVDVFRALREQHLKSQLILQVHDELIIDALPEELDVVEQLLANCMRDAIQLKVPLKIDMQTGANWYEAK